MTVFSFEEDDPENPLGQRSPDEVRHLPFGAAELSRDGLVLSYNDTEPDDGGVGSISLIGRDFFSDVARWGHPSAIHAEFMRGVESGDLNAVFDCAVSKVPYRVRVHFKISPILGTYWVFIKKLNRFPV